MASQSYLCMQYNFLSLGDQLDMLNVYILTSFCYFIFSFYVPFNLFNTF